MKKGLILAWFLALAATCAACSSPAGLLEETCDLAVTRLSAVPRLGLSKVTGSFTDNGHPYDGCVVRLDGDRTDSNEIQDPRPLFYPSEGTALYRQGWRADREADGPDGTSFRISREKVFCIVEGRWDGGDDSDPEYVPSTRFGITVSCSYRE